MSERRTIGLSGNLRLVCRADSSGRTFLAEQSFAAPMHLSKPYWDGEVLLVNVINQTAGIFGGDRITTQVVVESGARVLLSSPSAARFHPSAGRESHLEQRLEVRAGGSLDVFPEISIPQRDSRSFQKTGVQIEEGGELIYLETLAPGRVASGEIFTFARYAWQTQIRIGHRAVHRERAVISRDDARSLQALTAIFPVSYYAGVVVISPTSESWTSDFAHAVSALNDVTTVRIGASKLCAGGWSVRVLARDSLALRECLHGLRQLIYRSLGREMPSARRNDQPCGV